MIVADKNSSGLLSLGIYIYGGMILLWSEDDKDGYGTNIYTS